MAKNTNIKPVTNIKNKQGSVVKTPTVIKIEQKKVWYNDFKIQSIIIALLAFGFYCNTFNHEVALDDTGIIVQNDYVQEGFAGIPKILSSDAFESYYKQFNSGNVLSGGRYRPLSIVTFAIEQQFLGVNPPLPDSLKNTQKGVAIKAEQAKKLIPDMHIRHFFNVIWYILSLIALLYFLRYVVFKNNYLMAFIATLIFTIHPLHTEVIANVKSRDEIMSLLFISLTFIFAFKYQEHKKPWMLFVGLLSYFLAFLSKEYAITLVVLIPLAFYLFNGYTISKSIMAVLPFLGVVAIYMVIRLQIVAPMNEDSEKDLMNNPYAAATDIEKIATEISTQLNYLKLLLFPHPLSADYSYNQIPYVDFANGKVWLSLLTHIGLVFAFFYFLIKRNILCFALGFYLFNLMLICNIFFNIGATMGERLIYHSSVGFAIAVAYFLYKGAEKIDFENKGKFVLLTLLVALTGLCGYKTITRNQDWKNDIVLFFHDINVSPNSTLINANVAATYINMSEREKDESKKIEDLHKGIAYINKELSINNTHVSGYFNRGQAYLKLHQPDSAKYNMDMVLKLFPKYPNMAEIYYNIGVNYYLDKRYPEAIGIWKTVLKLQPDYILAQKSINTAILQMSQPAPPQK